MSEVEDILRATLIAGVEGQGAHTEASRMLDGLDWQLAGRRLAEAPYTIQQEASHIVYWNDYAVAASKGESPAAPEHAVDGWPGPEAPADAAAWEAFVLEYKASLEALAGEIRRIAVGEMMPGGRRSRADVLRAMGNHVSYHVGQIALLRRMMNAWPPPGGGDTW